MTKKRTFIVVLLGVALFAGAASARTTAVPRNTAAPTVTGTTREGNTLTAHNGSWANSPTSFAYQWQRCASDGTGCGDISGATSKTYTLAAADVDHAVRVNVTASNPDGQAGANSAATSLVSSHAAPVNTAAPVISGTAKPGEQLSTTNGTWTGGATSFTYQWQRCTASAVCTDVSGATAPTYGVRSADAGSTIRVIVTAHNASGSTAAANSSMTGVVTASPASTVTVQGHKNHAPSLQFLSLKRVGKLVYSRFRVCDDSTARVKITERDTHLGVAAYARHYAVAAKPCTMYSRHWVLATRFRHGRYTATLQARDRQGATSPVKHRTLVFPSL
ncbi:MAG TPA: hypothetical protein VGL76_12480 [Gaiellaceae bacterium]